jgi:CCR4-NOT transcription complex subunit 1
MRYPNAHTLFFSRLVLGAFLDGAGSAASSPAVAEVVREQLTRVLLERLIAHRPHPWGLLVTFIELIKSATYNFWSHGFTKHNADIEKLFESVAKSCMGMSAASAAESTASGQGDA